eukprot:Lithocolla_globosa_v1_NODE_1415_length_2598_cov_14.531890.p2 type:complete len:103 gc:universal NODE_1415_length_2598_cov_14.531890:586-278(-)
MLEQARSSNHVQERVVTGSEYSKLKKKGFEAVIDQPGEPIDTIQLDFPRYTMKQLLRLCCGTYQLKLLTQLSILILRGVMNFPAIVRVIYSVFKYSRDTQML